MTEFELGNRLIRKSVQYSIWCVTCDMFEDYEEYRNQTMAIKSYRLLGWKKTKLGWQCPKCLGAR